MIGDETSVRLNRMSNNNLCDYFFPLHLERCEHSSLLLVGEREDIVIIVVSQFYSFQANDREINKNQR